MLDALRQDLRYALRGLVNRPGFALAVVLTLALGIGANAAMFSIVDRLLFRPPPMLRDPARVHRIYLAETYRGTEYDHGYFPYARFVDLTRDTRSFTRTAMFAEQDLAVGTGTDARRVKVGIVTARFFGFFDAPPALGRYFGTAEDVPPTGTPVAVLSYGLWETRYGGSPDVLGEALQIGPTRYRIVGVAPRGFAGLWPDAPPAAFVPMSVVGSQREAAFRKEGEDWWTTYHWQWAQMIAERRPGVTRARAAADLSRADLRSYETQATREPRARARDLDEVKPHALVASVLADRGPNETKVAKVATWIGGVAMIVWLIACANVANLLLGRALERRREIAVRLALGVSRLRLAAHLLTESLLLGLVGGVAGVLLAQWGGTVLRSAFLSSTSAATVITDPRTLVYAGAAALVAGLLTGLAPLAQSRHSDLRRDLREGGRQGTRRSSRLRAGLLVLQGALCVVLLVGAGLFVRSLDHVRSVRLGYTPGQVLLVERSMRGVSIDSAAGAALIGRLRETALSIPGVVNATRQVTTPLYDMWDLNLYAPGVDSSRTRGEFELNAVSPSYFATVGTRVLEGRGIGPQDVAGAPPVMVVGRSMAERLWPHQDALGRCVRVDSQTAPCHYVVGVAEDIKANDLGGESTYYYYLSAAQFHPDEGGLFVRVRGDPDAMKEPVRKRLQALMPGASYVTVTPLRDFVTGQTKSWRLGATMFAIFGALALSLAAIGLYGVLAFDVRQRLHELGIRVALGASMRDIMGYVVSGGMKLAGAGIGLGLAIVLLLGRWAEPLLFEESPRDPSVLIAVTAILLGVAVLASFLPARRAARVDPMEALRHE
jgi:predicted permease